VGLAVNIIKSGDKRDSELFSKRKLRASVIAACLSVRTPAGQAEKIADAVCENVIQWLGDKPEVTSQDLRVVTGKHLHAHHPEAAYMYHQYRITI
jgi:transcriptional regulator NrdR family protein